jgi:hypothetical protein
VSGAPDINDILNTKSLYKKLADTLLEEAIVQTAYAVLKDDDYFKHIAQKVIVETKLSDYEYDTLRLYVITYLMKRFVRQK